MTDDLAYRGTWVRDGLILRPTTPPEIKRVPKPPPAKCGTDGGYYRHIRTLDEFPCDDCKAAHRTATRERANRKKAS